MSAILETAAPVAECPADKANYFAEIDPFDTPEAELRAVLADPDYSLWRRDQQEQGPGRCDLCGEPCGEMHGHGETPVIVHAACTHQAEAEWAEWEAQYDEFHRAAMEAEWAAMEAKYDTAHRSIMDADPEFRPIPF